MINFVLFSILKTIIYLDEVLSVYYFAKNNITKLRLKEGVVGRKLVEP